MKYVYLCGQVDKRVGSVKRSVRGVAEEMCRRSIKGGGYVEVMSAKGRVG